MQDNYLPIVLPMAGDILQNRYTDARRRYLDGASEHYPALRWPKRRSSKRKPFPGTVPGALTDEG